MSFSVSQAGPILEVSASGDYSVQDIQSQLEAILAEQDGPDRRSLIVDATNSEHSPSAEELHAVADFASTLLDRIDHRIALVVSNDLRFGLGRMLEVYGGEFGLEFKVFRDRPEALDWLTAG